MATLHLWVILGAAFTVFLWSLVLPGRRGDTVTAGKYTPLLIFLLAFLLRVILAANNSGFGVDIGCFSAWSERMLQLGPTQFYAPDYFSDYPPLYLYFLWGIGLVRKFFSLEYLSPSHLVLLKLPSILADLGTGYLLYRVGRKRLGIVSALALSCIYLFQPVILMNSCLWGQIDSLFTFTLLLVCLFLEQDRLLPAYLLYCLGVLLKPQMLIFAPLLIVQALQYVFRGHFSSHRLLRVLGYGSLSALLAVLLAAPFGLDKVFLQYTDTLSSYPYASVNAYNFWAGLGRNWASQNSLFLGLPCVTWGNLAIVAATVFCILIGYRFREIPGKYGLMGAVLILTVFTFSVRMHERYLYPVMGLLLLSYPSLAARQINGAAAKNPKNHPVALTPSLRCFYPAVFTLLACLHFYNTGHVLYFYDPTNFSAKAPILLLTGIGTTICTVLFYVLLAALRRDKEGVSLPGAMQPARPGALFSPPEKALEISSKERRMTRTDLRLLLGITILYSLFALRDLGDRKAPETVHTVSQSETLSFSFSEGHAAAALSYYIAPEHGRSFSFRMTPADADADASSEDAFADYSLENVFTWRTITFPEPCSALSMTLSQGSAHLIELVFLDADGNPVRPENASDYPALFDEEALYPKTFSFRNSMYFDEIYHGRTAYEFRNGMRSYENTHPPFGKILISWGVALFGMNPFGWRIVGTLIGILMLPVLYLFAKRLTGNTPAAALACWIFAFDFMHFAQTRIATIDVYIVFFTICMYACLYRFLTADYWADGYERRLLLPLALCGVSMGFGVASKWTGVYAGLGMGILFFLHLGELARAYFRAKENPAGKTGAYSNRKILEVFPARTMRVIGFCLIFFVLVPAAIYLLSYLPFRDGSDRGLFARMLKNQETMFSYHSNLNATHYFASPFYEWPLIIRPIWYYSGVLENGLREGISSFGNPLVWWAGIPAFCYMVYLLFKKRDRNALFLIIGYLAQYVPWFFVTRITFIYHYFPSVVFVVLMIAYSFRNFMEGGLRKKTLAALIAYGAAVFLLFWLFYPVLAGQPVSLTFVKKFLKWFDTWVLVSG